MLVPKNSPVCAWPTRRGCRVTYSTPSNSGISSRNRLTSASTRQANSVDEPQGRAWGRERVRDCSKAAFNYCSLSCLVLSLGTRLCIAAEFLQNTRPFAAAILLEIRLTHSL